MTDTSTVTAAEPVPTLTPVPPDTEACRRDRRGDVLAYAAIGFMFFIVVVLIFVKMDQFLHDILLVIIGAMVGIAKDVYGFQFGSSQGSQAKTDQLTAIVAAQNPPQA